ncbi:hypothetical protein M9458_020565, partial [Cirrhinus mrigala]
TPLICLATTAEIGALISPDMEDLLQGLTEVSIRQQQIVEHLATRQGRTEEELAAIRSTTAPRVPLSNHRAQAIGLLPKMTAGDDIEAFLRVFETTATHEGWEQDEWARALAPLLTGEAQRAYFSLPPAAAKDYSEVKREILARLDLSPICAAQKFNEWEYKARVPARAQAAELTRLAHYWLLEGDPTAAQVAEWVAVDRLLRALPLSHLQAVGMKNPSTTLELVEAIELADAVHHREAGERAPPFPWRVVQEQRTLEGTPRPVSRLMAPSPQDESMPTAEPPKRLAGLAHSYPMVGHLGAANTIQRICDRFHWPGLEADVKGFCQACPTCQITAPRTPPPSPLIPLPIIEVPFKRIGMDLVGPLPKSAQGHEHILVIVDYATQYPEAVPLRKATAKAIAQELFLLASRVGIPTEILTDQGTPFIVTVLIVVSMIADNKQKSKKGAGQ